MRKYFIMNNKNYPHMYALGERGMALLLTLLVTIILTVVVLEFNYLIRVYATLSGNLVDDLQAQAAARGGIETAKALLLNDLKNDMDKSIRVDTLEEEWAEEIDFTTPASSAKTKITDEMSKLNLNRLIKGTLSETAIESKNIEMVENMKYLFELLDLDPGLVDCIVDWIDENDQEEPLGAEDSYYQSLDPPRYCKNGPLDSVEELLLIKGFDEEILFGDDENPGLAAYVTVFGDPKGLVNINTADEVVLSAVLKSEAAGSSAFDSRQDDPFETAADLTARLPDIDPARKFATGSSYFLITATGTVPAEGDPVRTLKIKTLLKRSMPQGLETSENYLQLETAYWKVER
ncbi:MAG: general secretion pathway protein GspK [Candidatus Abyssobacteria bacterium SURF_5]|uniref:General secretion pathway protein GspK n=1 Tax=Abyssobacteria bacterium (strain SURF_5) TaxID=2093360 RepID=A0A3A4P2X6_ABYX5|nr:MAG: general secretion pathway protein GspK [Candidatus Abyssubacteria bacterium SURF_5]